MKKDILKKIAFRMITSVIVLFILISFVFFVINISPGNPAQKYISPKIDNQVYEKISESFKLNETMSSRYFAFLGNVLEGNLGISYTYQKPVISVILEYLPFTVFFSFLSFSIQLILSFFLVYFVTFRNSKILKKIIDAIVLVFYSIPLFLVSVLFIYLFSFKLSLFPSAGLRSFDFGSLTFLDRIIDYFRHLFLPLIASAIVSVPVYYRYFLNSVTQNSLSSFVSKLKILGLSNRKIFFKHIFPNSLNTVIAIAGIELGALLSGSILVETIFSLPGMGRLTMNAVAVRDYPLIIGTIFTAAIMILLVNLIADITRIFIDKRLLKGILS